MLSFTSRDIVDILLCMLDAGVAAGVAHLQRTSCSDKIDPLPAALCPSHPAAKTAIAAAIGEASPVLLCCLAAYSSARMGCFAGDSSGAFANAVCSTNPQEIISTFVGTAVGSITAAAAEQHLGGWGAAAVGSAAGYASSKLLSTFCGYICRTRGEESISLNNDPQSGYGATPRLGYSQV
jgi:hypothetical protein